jgi:hypothetical protein
MNKETNPILITFKLLRRAVGWLGITLPIVLSIGLYCINCCCIQDSISQYYYTRMGAYLTGTLCAVGLFLFAYKGYPEENDGKWCNFAAICAFGVAFIPMKLLPGDVPDTNCIVFFSQGLDCFRIMHFISAGLLFFTLGYLSLFKFTKTNKDKIKKEDKKYSRNIVYRTCGIIIFVCLLILMIYLSICHFKTDFKINTLTFWMETVMLLAFGTSWLVKGEGIKILND